MSSVWTFLKRNKGKLALTGAAIGAGVYVAQRVVQQRQALTDRLLVRSDLGSDARKRYVFDSQQRTADDTVETLMKTIWRRIAQRFDVESIASLLKGDVAADMTEEEKIAHWRRMFVGAVSRVVTTSYALAYIVLTLKCQVSMVAGRTFTLSDVGVDGEEETLVDQVLTAVGWNSVSKSSADATRSTNIAPSTSAAAQHAFLQCAHYFVTTSLNDLCAQVETVCVEAVKPWALTDNMTFDALTGLLYDIRRNMHVNLVDMMVPLNASSSSDPALTSLLSTLRTHLASPAADDWLKAQQNYTCGQFLTTVRASMHDECLVARLIPMLSKSYAPLIDAGEFDAPLQHALCDATLHEISVDVFERTIC